MERKHKSDPTLRLKNAIVQLVDAQSLTAAFRIPDAAADLEVCADLTRRTLTYGMKLKAPLDRKSTKARVNWLLRMLPEDDPRLLIRAHWPGRAAPTQELVGALRGTPESLQTDNPEATPHSFEVLLVEDLGGDFSGTRKFIERLEAGIGAFYDLAGQNLRAWQAPPPRPVASRPTDTGTGSDGASAQSTATAAAPGTQVDSSPTDPPAE